MLKFFKKLKLYTKFPQEIVQVFLSNLFVTNCTSPSTKVFFTKERHIDGSSVKSITLSENTSGICQIAFPFFTVTVIFYTVFCVLW